MAPFAAQLPVPVVVNDELLQRHVPVPEFETPDFEEDEHEPRGSAVQDVVPPPHEASIVALK